MRGPLTAALVGTFILALVTAACGKQKAERCQSGECLVVESCLKGDCNGPVVVTGCGCACLPGEVKGNTCPPKEHVLSQAADAGHD